MQPARGLASTLRRKWQDEIVSLLWHFTLTPVITSAPQYTYAVESQQFPECILFAVQSFLD